ncbi:MAG: hypothetical protein CVV49_00510 [Spirochaetae bacterium HGW-Spirochaetae-5]|nr:MAG: hypothetical protein CVV49_00510 [Spirochaetae bacterium HGW-Spirochaetae-5]
MKFIKKYKWIILMIFLICGFILFIWLYYHKFICYSQGYQVTSGVFGDYMGGVLGSTFAFLSFMALLYTIHLQHKELISAREEANEQKKLVSNQIEIMNIQNFETTFFNMLNQISNIINLYDFNSQSGASYFTNNLKNLWRDYDKVKRFEIHDVDKYLDANKKYLYDFRNFVLHISNIVRLIHNSKFEVLRLEMYYDILNGYLSHLQKFYIEVCRNSESFKHIKQYLEFVDRSRKIWEEGCKQEIEKDTVKITSG